MNQRLQIGIHDIGLSIVNDINHEEILYISLNKSKVIWTELKRSRARPLSSNINMKLEEFYQILTQQHVVSENNKDILRRKFSTEDIRV